ncbi:adenylate/guanylate cyclase domain-containing protein [Tamlana sp. 2201CG12-4]|uniref:adenylate/guanylate cyclase domain-containing protein n=1 Tax=Tamlana sp. 2201CG12-4 TaxID=3112582 RepID=UPI002DBC83F8|nr:adenylate/guanylate cyclase domain-containing protein [Tamlana sp. 2201CG12-4]MEC3908857.1 adenylate/guanylate cyclase domain-containing protein [Tamlana sp. 2201CG12-4]
MSLKKFLVYIIQSVAFWMFAFFLYIFIKYNGLEKELKIYTDDILNLPEFEYYQFALMLGIIMGIFYAIVEFLFDVYFSKKMVLGAGILVKSVIYFALIVVILSILSVFIEERIDIDLPNERGWWHKDPFFWNTVLYFVASSIVFALIKIANDKFGPGVFLNMILGTYKKPKEESRILMFLDLKNSTKIAEQLGHEVYSKFIQDCFIDLNSVLRRYEADVYQYVGDEAVLTWTTKKGFRKNNSVNLFFAFIDKLKSREAYYQKKYNYQPEFKAGVHCGKLMIAEVGTIKKELAFHGDVINTASRIQDLCNTYNAELLVSQSVLEKSLITLKYEAKLLGDLELKGKIKTLKVYAIANHKS